MRLALLLCLLGLGCSASVPQRPAPLGYLALALPPPDGFERVWYYRVSSHGVDSTEFVCRPEDEVPCPAIEQFEDGTYAPLVPEEGEMLLGVGELFSTGGYRLYFTRVEHTREEVVATYTLRRPGSDCGTTQAFTFPNEVVRIPYSDLSVRFVREIKTTSCEEPEE